VSNDKRGIFDPKRAEKADEPADLSQASQTGMKTHASEYYEPGRVAVGMAPGGGVRIEGDPPPPPPEGLTDDNLICTSAADRPECEHYVALLLDAEGVFRGGSTQPRQIRRFCRRLATASELMDLEGLNVYACSSRSPRDSVSAGLLRKFEDHQREKAAEVAATGGEMDL
jgi:hypothetical protein